MHSASNDKAEKVEKEDAVTIIPVTEDSSSRGAGINPHPLADKLIYIAGDYPKYADVKKSDNSDYYNAYIESLKEVLKDVRYAEGDDVLEKQLGELLRNKKVTMATAESCTGGYIAHLITSIAGSSDYFKGSVVSYANEVKVNVLGVNAADLEREGAVSEAVVLQMAEGVRKITGADYAVSTSGVAGPGGGTPEKPVGTVWIGVATPRKSYAKLFTFSFTRERNIAKAASKAMEMLLEEVRENEK